jgi:bifunctional DNA-binding transcriptional regulator/antitoxin component of YhaV-PrlF toxin-antitoxin module
MSAGRIVLPAEVREYFAAIGRRGGQSGRRELTREQAKLMVAIREAKRHAKKTSTTPPRLTRKQQEILGKRKHHRPNDPS